MICGKCGKDNAAGKFYCTECGTNLGLGTGATPSVQPHTATVSANSTSPMAIGCLGVLGLVALIGVGLLLSGRLTDLVWRSGPRIMFSREALSNGRTDTIRPTSRANPMGLRAVAGFGNPDTKAPGLLTTISEQPNPMRITLDKDKNGRVDGVSNPIARDAAGLLSCFSLLVTDDFPADGTRWENIGARDGAGSFYATVNIPSANIFAGQELITDAELRAYTANSIIYEAPDYGISPASVIDTKGTIRVRAAPRPQPDTPRRQDLLEAPEINYARDVKVEIEVLSSCEHPDGDLELKLRAKLTGFDPVADSHFRWAFDGNGVKFVKDAVADEEVTFQIPANQKGQQARIWVAVSSKGIAVGNPNPFVQQPPKQEVGNMTFVTAGSAVAAMIPFTVKANCGGATQSIPQTTPDDGFGEITLKSIFIRRTYCTPDGASKTETETRNVPLAPIQYTSRYTDAYFDYDVNTTLTLQAPSTVRPDTEFDVAATFDVTWNVRKFTPGIDHYALKASAILETYRNGRLQTEAKPPGSGQITPGTHRATVKINGKQARGGPAGGNDLWNIGGTAWNPRLGCNDEVQVLLIYDIFGR